MIKTTYEYREATLDDLERIWDMNIADNADKKRWIAWKNEYISYNQSGKALTFVILCDGEPVGEGTLLFSAECGAIGGRTVLADDTNVANINGLRIRKEHEGKGHISALVRKMESYAVKNGYTHLTIGVEATETRNLAIYRHWGYDQFVMSETENGELVLYYKKNLKKGNV